MSTTNTSEVTSLSTLAPLSPLPPQYGSLIFTLSLVLVSEVGALEYSTQTVLDADEEEHLQFNQIAIKHIV